LDGTPPLAAYEATIQLTPITAASEESNTTTTTTTISTTTGCRCEWWADFIVLNQVGKVSNSLEEFQYQQNEISTLFLDALRILKDILSNK
jgi:hypothetical protein